MTGDVMQDLGIHPGRRNNTRFAPTPRSGLHIGHVWLAWLNYEEARRRGGKFIVRMETMLIKRNQIDEIKHDNTFMKRDVAMILDQLEWLGIPPDFVSWEDVEQLVVDAVLEQHPEIPRTSVPMNFTIGTKDSTGIRCAFHETAPRVISDYYLGCDPVIRGDDLLCEHFFYVWMCQHLGFPIPEMIYVPRIRNEEGRELSRTTGATGIDDMRKKGLTPDDIFSIIRQTCLAEPDGEVSLANLAYNPIVRS